MIRGILLLSFFIAVCRTVEFGDNLYLITSPYTYPADKNVTVTVDVFGSKSCNVTLQIKKGNTHITTGGTVKPGVRGEFTLKIQSHQLHRYHWRNTFEFNATICGEKTKTKRVYAVATKKSIIFIQTDKPVYKPGQKIRMRIISLDKDLKPKGERVDKAYVTASSTRIKQWNNITMEDGIASLEMQLSKEPVEGDYKITAIVGIEKKVQKVVVKKYVLPKFEVKITPPSYIALDQKNFDTKICAKYTYGKNVRGILTAELCLKQREHRWLRNPYKTCHTIAKEIDGCTDIVTTREALNVADVINTWNAEFMIEAKVKENLTGVTLGGHAKTTQFYKRSVLLSFVGSSEKFKPGLPYNYVLKVTHPDGNPITGANVRVSVKQGYSGSKIYERNFTVKNGFVDDVLESKTLNSNNLVFRAELLDPNPYSIEKNNPVSAYKSVKPWYSPSFSYLEIIKETKTPVKIGKEAPLIVRYTVRNDTGKDVKFLYTVKCGDFTKSGVYNVTHDYIKEIKNTESPLTTTMTTIMDTDLTTDETMFNTEATTPPQLFIKRRRKPDVVYTMDSKPIVEKFQLKIPVTIDMMPSCHVIVYYVRKDKEVVADSLDFDVEDRLKNEVSVSFEEKEKKPGEKTNFILKASPGSRVAFVAVDKSVHLLKDGNELTKEKIRPFLQRYTQAAPDACDYWFWGKRKRSIAPYWDSSYHDASYAFSNVGSVYLSNLQVETKPCPQIVPLTLLSRVVNERVTEGIMRFKNKRPRVRKNFPETWLWADEKIGETGEKVVQVTVPDTITTWVANGFAMSSKKGLGISDTATIKAFQPFFVQMTLPYSVIRGEEIPVTVTVFNYLSGCTGIRLQLNHRSLDYKVTSYHIEKLCVCGDSGQSVKFSIIPLKLGHIPLTVTATSSSAKLCPSSSVVVQDAVTRRLLVEPEGIREEYTQSTFFCPKEKEYSEVFDLKLPKNIVSGSVYPTVTFIGDIMGPALNNLENLLRMPYGCGEQNMANFAPNIYIMDYLKKTGQLTESIKEKAVNFMEIGYQRELRYKRHSGSYSAFGNSDDAGSMMLTAFVVRSYARARKYIFVDDNEIKDSVKWFENKQKKTGCFPQHGHLFHRGLQGGVDSEVTLTAYVTTALLEAGWSTKSTIVSKALSCIENHLESINDTYATALISYTLALAKHNETLNMLTLLRRKAIKNGDFMYWKNNNAKPQSTFSYYYKPSAEVEMTAYALLAILEYNKDNFVLNDELMDIIRWLSKQRNQYGGFASTQDTCVALQALSTFAGKAYGSNADFRSTLLTGSLKMGNYYKHDFSITQENKLTLQMIELPPKIIPGKLTLSGQGKGCALTQVSLKYNVPEPEDVPAFEIKVNVRTRRSLPEEANSACNPLKLEIKVIWLKEDVSNMAVVDVKLVTGFSVIEASLKRLRDDKNLNFKRYDIDEQNVQLYFDEIKNVTFSIDIHQDTLVKKLKPAVVKVYDYYEPERQAKVMYEIREADCYGNRIIRECPRCLTLPDIHKEIKTTLACNSTVTRMTSKNGHLMVIKAFSRDTKEMRKKIIKKELEYRISDFCPCDEIYEGERSIVIGGNSYFKDIEGERTMIMLDGETTILKYTGKSMKPKIKKMKKMLKACRRGGM